MAVTAVSNQQQSPAASSMHQMLHHSRASSSQSLADTDDAVSSATPSTHRPYIFMQSCNGGPQQFAVDSGTNATPSFYSVRPPNMPEPYDMISSRCPMDIASMQKSMPKPMAKPMPKSMAKSDETELVRNSNRGNNTSAAHEQTTSTATTTSTSAAATTTSVMQQRVHPQTNVIYKVSSRPLTPDYAKSYPVMDTTVASSVKGEPELNIGKERNVI